MGPALRAQRLADKRRMKQYADVGLRLDPHVGIANLFDVVELVVPDRNVRSSHLAAENLCELHLLRIAGAVSHRTLRRDGDNAVLFVFRSALFERTDHVLADIAGEPFVNCIVF